jgi:hypothetical protein
LVCGLIALRRHLQLRKIDRGTGRRTERDADRERDRAASAARE